MKCEKNILAKTDPRVHIKIENSGTTEEKCEFRCVGYSSEIRVTAEQLAEFGNRPIADVKDHMTKLGDVEGDHYHERLAVLVKWLLEGRYQQ